jgi:hypothetical protein
MKLAALEFRTNAPPRDKVFHDMDIAARSLELIDPAGSVQG